MAKLGKRADGYTVIAIAYDGVPILKQVGKSRLFNTAAKRAALRRDLQRLMRQHGVFTKD